MNGPTWYEIRVRSHLGTISEASFEGSIIRHRQDGTTLLVVPITDQAALHGILTKIRDLGLSLIEVKQVENPTPFT